MGQLVAPLVSTDNIIETGEPTEKQFGLWARTGCGNHVLHGGPEVLRDVAMATNFGTEFAVTGFVGYYFGCVIASDMLFDGGGFPGSSYPMKI